MSTAHRFHLLGKRMSEPLSPPERLRAKFHIKCPSMRNTLSEFFGTAMLLFIGLGVVMQFILSHEKLNTWIQVNIGWGFNIVFCVYLCSNTSGGHLNPAVSFTMYTLGKLSLKDFGLYCIAQLLGAIVGAAAAYGLFYDQFTKFAGDYRVIYGSKATAACFCSYPADHVSNLTSFFDQIAGTGLLVLFVCAVADKRNKIPAAAHPFLFGCVLMMIGCCYGMNLGYPINPARDLGPRIFSYFIYGSAVFTVRNYYFWIPVVAPMIGGPLGAWMYYFFVGAHIPEAKELKELEYDDEMKKPLRNGDDV